MTIAFSEKYGFWTTRYSFEPTCYASVDNDFLSSKASEGVWIHDDPDVDRNSFYGEGYASEILISSNQDPSAIKFYKSVSVETNADNILATVTTNEEYSGTERQSGYTDSFVNREGFKYAEMPRSVINSTGNISSIPIMFLGYYVDILNGEILSPFSELGGGGDQSEYILVKLIAENQFPIDIGAEIKVLDDSGNLTNPLWNGMGVNPNFFNTDEPTYVYSTGVHETGFFEVVVAVKKGPHFYNDEGNLNSLGTTAIFNHLTLEGSFAEGYLSSFLENFSSDNGYGPAWGNYNPFLLLQLNLNSNNITSFLQGYYNMTPFTNGFGDAGAAFPAFTVSNSAVNGDQMRGPYAKVRLTISDTTPFELHAVNVDYSFSKLDARLTQNS